MTTRYTPFRRSRATVLAAAAGGSMLLAACSGGSADTSAQGAADGPETSGTGEVKVAASIYPLAWVVEQVGGDRVTVTDLTPAGSDAHHLELSPATVDAMSQDQLVVYLAQFQPAVDDAVATLGDGVATYDVTSEADLLPAVDAHASHDDHAHEGEGEHAHDHSIGGMDPHFWLHPERLSAVALQVGEKLAEVDPQGAETYRANAQSTAEELTALASEMSEGLSQCSSHSIVVTHEAYGYLTSPHDIQMIGISGIDPESEPSPARIAEIEKQIEGSDATTVFGEIQVDQKAAKVIAEQTGLKEATLDPLASRVNADATYPEQMRMNLDALRAALDCQ